MPRNSMVVRAGSLPALFGKPLPKYMTSDEIHNALDQAGKERDRLMMEIMWQTGVRSGELLMLTMDSIDFNAAVLRAPTLKRRRPHVRVIPLKAGLLGQLARYIAGERIGHEERLFSIKHARLFQIVQAACLKAGIEKARAHPHTWRHSFAIHCVLNRVPITILNDWLGHGAIENTLIYSRVVAGDARRFYEEMIF